MKASSRLAKEILTILQISPTLSLNNSRSSLPLIERLQHPREHGVSRSRKGHAKNRLVGWRGIHER